jgi:hypothetical protein
MAAPEINAAPGGPDSNSYCTLDEANAYHETRLHTTDWDIATDPTKAKALLWAARLLDSQIAWEGYPTDPDHQALLWPRIGMYDGDPIDSGLYDGVGRILSDSEIPQALKDAQAELAMYLIANDRTAELSTEGLGDVSVGPVKVGFNQGNSPKRRVIPEAVYEMISLWGDRKYSASGMINLVRA